MGKIKFHIFSVFRGIEKSVSYWKKNRKSFIFKAKSEISLFFTNNMSLARNKKNKGKKLEIVVLSTPPYSCQHQCIRRTINIKYRTCRFILWKALHWVSVVCFWQSYFFRWDLGCCQYAKNAASLLSLASAS